MVPGSEDAFKKVAESLRNLLIVIGQGKYQIKITGRIRQIDDFPDFRFDGRDIFSFDRRFSDQIEGVDFLRHAVFQYLEIVELQKIDESIAVEDANRHFDIDDPDFMG